MTQQTDICTAFPKAHPAAAAPSTHIARYTDKQLHPCAHDLAQCRQQIESRMPYAAAEPLNQFICDVFADDDLVHAFFLPVGMSVLAGQPPVMPLDLCQRDATKAASYSVLLHRQEREMAAAAAFVQTCGYYWCVRQQVLDQQSSLIASSPRAYRARIAAASRALLEEPLRRLRRSQPELGQTLAKVLGVGVGEPSDVDAQQVARVQAALGAVHLQVH